MAKKKSKTKKGSKKGPKKSASGFKLVPLGSRVILKPITDELNKTSSGIIIPETVEKEKSERGRVVAVGEGKYEDGKLLPVRVKVGDIVLFSKYGYDEVKMNGEEYFILNEDNILAIIK